MATSQRNTPQEDRRKRKRTSFAGEKSLQPASVIAKSAGNKGTHSYGQILYPLGLRTETIFVDVPEVDGPQPTRYVSDYGPGLIATELSQERVGDKLLGDIQLNGIRIAGLSSVSRSCAVAIGAEAKSSNTGASLREAKHQWSSLAYLNLLERVRVVREKPYDGNTNICQFGYLICGVGVQVFHVKIESVKSKGRKSEVYNNYSIFPIKPVAHCKLTTED